MSSSGRLYGILLQLYPARFREQYATDMLQDFEADHREARTICGQVRFWYDMLGDLMIAVPRQQGHEAVLRIAQSKRIAAWILRRMFRCWWRPRYRLPQCPAFWGEPMPRLTWMDVAGNVIGIFGIEVLQVLAWQCSLDGPAPTRLLTGTMIAVCNGFLLVGLAGQLVPRGRSHRG